MLSVRNMMRAPIAAAYWLGVGQGRRVGNGEDVIYLCHGTPRRLGPRLERQLRYLRRAFDIVPLATMAASLGAPRKGRRRRAVITFDDGLRSNVQVAYPILRALGIPATFFVCPGLIEARRWLWTHEARHRLAFAGRHLRHKLALELGAPAAEVDAFVDWMKGIDYGRRKRVETRLRQATAAFVPSELHREASDLAAWEELRALDPALVTVGSHTLTHPVLPSLSDAEIEAELRDSRRIIEEKLGRPAEFLSYPNGDVDERTLAGARRYYRAAVRCGSPIHSDPHLMPTVPLPRGVLALAWKTSRPGVPGAELSQAHQ